MKPSETLAAALELFGPNGERWSPNSGLYSPSTGCFCAIGAKNKAKYGNHYGPDQKWVAAASYQMDPEAQALLETISNPAYTDIWDVALYNDGRKDFGAIRDWFNRAIDFAKQAEQ